MGVSFATDPGRLNGWKEIALHLGKGTRTVQRWEKLYGLPVHRMGREGGEIVYAFRDEIDRWLSTADRGLEIGEDDAREPEPTPAERVASAPAVAAAPTAVRPRSLWDRHGVGLGVLLACAATVVVTAWTLRAHEAAQRAVVATTRQPASWRLAHESLVVLDARGDLLFRHDFGLPLGGPVSSESRKPDVGYLPVLLADVDADGRSEVLVNLNAEDRAERKLYCFEANGTLRFVHQPTGSRRFGDDVYGEPWLAFRAFVTRGEGGHRRLWAVFTHNLMFPAVLRELDPRDGTVRQEYWSNGYVDVVQEATWAGRRVLLVGGTNNDFRAGSLAVFPVDAVAGSTPAVRAGYACRDCAPGGPETLFVFPTVCAARQGQAGVHGVWVEGGDRLRVTVGQPIDSTSGDLFATYYTLGPDGVPVSAEVSQEFRAVHGRLEREGIVDHPFGPRDQAAVLPVKRWDGRRFVDLPRVPVGD
jgi:hypothetical protein